MRIRQLLIIGVSIVLVAAIAVEGLGLPLERGVRAVVNPAGRVLTDAGQRIAAGLDELTQLGTYSEQLEALESENTALRIQLITLERLREQNRQLRQALGFQEQTDYRFVPADIINYHPNPARNLLRINLGSDAGIGSNQSVVAPSGALAGVTSQVDATRATVVLISDTRFRALATASQSDATGVVRGQIGDSLIMEQIPQEATLEPGDTIVTSGLDGVYPPGLLIGTVTAISQDPGSVFKTAQLEPASDVRTVQFVMVLQ